MKNVVIIFVLALGILSCNQNELPKNVMDEQKLVKVLVDMEITDSYLNHVYQPDTQKMQAHTRYNYIFKKHKIDSAKFTNSLKYYSLDPKNMHAIYTLVEDSITKWEIALKPKPKRVKKVKKVKNVKDDLPVQ
ncbi:DUF4296 domain-containing protein [Pedobacter alpinus]|uniref:DUF4296 domain-containing protein n=1 Tax=Pedobacter alpinus TaxID=1590643 RepID=A0ABW5TX60_9SPHI